jgi:hypothetical protein
MLDILTPKGQVTVEQERRLAGIVEATWPGCAYIDTDKVTIADVDAIIVRGGKLVAVAETKCRDMTRAQLFGEYRGDWLVTFDKLVRAQQCARALQTDLWGLIYLVPDDVVLRIKLYSPSVGWLVQIHVRKTKTQRTVNGGTAVRDNAYINVSAADILVAR